MPTAMRRRFVGRARARPAAARGPWEHRVDSLRQLVRRVTARVARVGSDRRARSAGRGCADRANGPLLRRRLSLPGWGFVGAAALVLVAATMVVLSDYPPGQFSSVLPGDRPDDDAAGGTVAAPDPPLPSDWAPGTGPGLTIPGIDLRVAPRPSGDLAAVERVISPEPITRLMLAVPPLLPDTDGPLARLVKLRIVADGERLPASISEEAELGGEVLLTAPTSQIVLRYRLAGADVRSAQASPGRVSLSLRPAASGVVPSSPAVVTVRGAVVHTMVCLEVPADRRLCGVDDSGVWHTQNLIAASSSVLALVDLPGA